MAGRLTVPKPRIIFHKARPDRTGRQMDWRLSYSWWCCVLLGASPRHPVVRQTRASAESKSAPALGPRDGRQDHSCPVAPPTNNPEMRLSVPPSLRHALARSSLDRWAKARGGNVSKQFMCRYEVDTSEPARRRWRLPPQCGNLGVNAKCTFAYAPVGLDGVLSPSRRLRRVYTSCMTGVADLRPCSTCSERLLPRRS